MEIEDKLSRISMSNSALTSLTIMRRCLLALFDGNLTVSTKRVKLGGLSSEEAVTIGTAFFETWLTIFRGIQRIERNSHLAIAVSK